MKSEAPTIPEAAVRIVKIASCPSLSGQSTLTYHIGCTADAEVHFRVYANSEAGFFSKEWVPLQAVQKVLEKAPGEKGVRSFLLYPLFRGRSLNTPGFLLAALKDAGLVQSSEGKRRSYERTDLAGFMAEVKALMESPVDLKVEESPTTGKKPQPAGPGKAAAARPKADATTNATPKPRGRPRKAP